MYFVDFVAVNLVSCMVIIAGLFDVFVTMSWWRFGKAVFSEEAFHVIMCVLWFVVWFNWGRIMGMLGGGVGCEYSCRGSLHFMDSESSCIGRKGNLSVSICMVGGPMFSWMKV